MWHQEVGIIILLLTLLENEISSTIKMKIISLKQIWDHCYSLPRQRD